MKAFVDPDTCIGCELCVSICPMVFSMNADSIAEAVSGEVPTESEMACRDAEADCPVQAIRLE